MIYCADTSPLRRAQFSNGVLSESVSDLLVLIQAGPEVAARVKEYLAGLDEFLKTSGECLQAHTREPLVYSRGSDIRNWVLEDCSPALEFLGCWTSEPLLYSQEVRDILTMEEFKEIVSSLDSEM